jgi:hypothetical protein
MLLACAVTVVALSPSFTHESAANAVSAPGSSAMRVYLDPETGTVTSTPSASATIEIDAAMENTLRHDDEGLVIDSHAGGAKSMNLQGRYGDVVMVRIGENGKAMICSGDESTVVKALNDNTTPTGAEVK